MNEYDVVVIGGGPGGYATAVRAGQAGLKTALIEKELVGGVCVHWGCVPTKAILKYAKLIYMKDAQKTHDHFYDNITTDYRTIQNKSIQIARRQGKRVEKILLREGVDLYEGTAHLDSKTDISIEPSGEKITGRNIVIATGSRAKEIPGIEFDGENIITTKEAVLLQNVPKSAVIIGSGMSGVEFATMWNRFGTKVTILEAKSSALPSEDADISAEAGNFFRKAGIELITGIKVQSVVKTSNGLEVTFSHGDKTEKLTTEKVLVAIGISPNSSGLGLEELGVEMINGFISIDENMCTNIPGISAVGDVTGQLPLAVVAASQGTAAAEYIAGDTPKTLLYDSIPHCIYGVAEIASSGLTEKRAKESGHSVFTVKNPLRTTAGGASMLSEDKGFVKLVIDSDTKKLLGVHMIGDNVSEIIAGPASLVSSGMIIQETGYDIQS